MQKLSETEQKELKEIFDLIDSDQSGVISLQELRKLMAALHLKPTEQELEEVFEETCSLPSITKASAGSPSASSLPLPPSFIAAAAPHDGSVVNNSHSDINASSEATAAAASARMVTFPQFATMMARRVQSEYTAKQLRNAFQLFESPDMPEGFVSTSVLAHALATYGSKKLDKEEIDRLMAAIDPNNTGRVNYYEFVDTVTM
ncbi:calmodulin [Leishmania donovani]|uniref:Calmodulin_-_putative n=3 Tax=Leishmania donovani species complex TaxID=38574 RepID=A0A6L0WNR0_LEIIN|nr:putative calmodulin [Leishmania infantum JPCM5]TPP50069.1 EF-hand domain pair family protein [Leishmania donovani]CAC9466346.1 calmodulin_-_putative [Leishmania infantum]CAJ1987207.1 calmodulin [Leishmania donovani]CAM66511.1 putative calmodulin [Leishmania infantum JPCM5]SUZ40166.1 calmodulin_-_putative [Leishmania infantum]|eukprot:XP_001464135.1 putative calmodulin [Leishmania infantum JPCM5]